MDMKRKLELVDQGLKSISTHTDEDAAVRKAALSRVAAMVEAETARIDAEVSARIAESVA